MKRFICALLLICMVFVACDMGNNGNDDDGFFSISNRNMGIKSLYISNISVNGNGRAASGSTIQTLSYINNLGQNAPFFFVSPSGKNIVLNVSEVQQLDEKRILVDFISYYVITAEGNVFTIGETIYTSGRALIDMESGKVYDFKEYRNIKLVSNDLLFSYDDNGTLYKVNLNVMSIAVPLNNPTYTPVFEIFPLLFGNKIVTFPTKDTSNKLSLDINNEFPPKLFINATLTSDLCSFINSPTTVEFLARFGNDLTGMVISDLSGNPYFYSFIGFNINGGNETDYFTGKLSIDDNGNMLLSDCYEGKHTFETNWTQRDFFNSQTQVESPIFLINSAGIGKMDYYGYVYYNRPYDFPYTCSQSFDILKSQSVILYSNNGFIHLKKKSKGIQVESIALSMPKVYAGSSFINRDNYLYYLEGSSIKRLYLASGETPEVVYSNSRLLLTGGASMDYLTASGSNLIFYQFADDNITVNTYSLAMYQQGATPKLLASSSIDVRDIIELDF